MINKNPMYKIEDNFLPEEDFIRLWDLIRPSLDGQFSWKWAPGTVNEIVAEKNSHFKSPSLFNKVTDIQPSNPIQSQIFAHVLWSHGGRNSSPFFDVFGKLLDKIDPLAFWRIQANFTTRQEKRSRSPFHIDYDGDKPLKHTSMFTSIFYMNTTNGPTLLEDGTEIECRANRLVSFPYDTYHSGVLCTDQQYRIVVNLNYFDEIKFKEK